MRKILCLSLLLINSVFAIGQAKKFDKKLFLLSIFFENSSMIDNEFLEHRLKLIPINCEYIDSISKDYENIYENIVISCKKQNENNENLISVYPVIVIPSVPYNGVPLNSFVKCESP